MVSNYSRKSIIEKSKTYAMIHKETLKTEKNVKNTSTKHFIYYG